jgi:enoyl-CoA hydratase/carnithine racemase
MPALMAEYKDLTVHSDDDIEVITINRPGVRNALRPRTYQELERAVHETTARCLVITGADPAFCSGDDVREIMVAGEASSPGAPSGDSQACSPVAPAGPSQRLSHNPRLTPAADALLYCDVPVVAAVNGAAVGWGMELALMADLRVASDRARFGELFVKRGLCSDVAGLARLAQLVGREKACELLMTGDVVDAAEAQRIGLVGRVVAHDDLLDHAKGLARKIAGNPPLAVRALKRGLRKALDPDWRDLGTFVSQTLGVLFLTEDHREGVRSFLEKRPPVYAGR